MNNQNSEYTSLAMTYVPWQKWKDLFDIEKALMCGTLFKSLYKPFGGAK